MASIASTTFSTRAGSGTVTISNSNLTNSGSETMEVSDIGTIELEFDIDENTDENSESVFFIPQRFKFSAFDKLSGGTSLFERIDTDLSSTDEVTVSFDFTTDGGLSWDDETIFTKNDIEYDRESREIQFDCYYKLEPFQATMADVFTTYSGDVYTFNQSGGGTRDCMPTREFIENMFNTIEPTATAINNSNSFVDDPFVDANETWVMFRDHDGTVFEQTDSSLNALYRLAAIDGSVVGNAMGFLFFTYRLDTTEDTTIEEDDVLGGSDGLIINPGLKNYRAISLWAYSVLGSTAVSDWSSHSFDYGEVDNLNDDAIKELHASYFMLELQPASWNQAGGDFDDDGFAAFSDTGADVTTDMPKGATIVPINSSSGLGPGDNFWFSDKRELYDVDTATASEIILNTPLRRDVDAVFSTGGNKSIFEEVGTDRSVLSRDAVDAYKKAYGADGSRLIRFQIIDIDNLLPYETVTLGTSFPAAVQSTYRPSKLEYDLTRDIIRVDAYEIV